MYQCNDVKNIMWSSRDLEPQTISSEKAPWHSWVREARSPDNKVKKGNVAATNSSSKNLVSVVVDDDDKFLLGSPGCT